MTRIPRAVVNGETTVRKRADELTEEDYGRIVQHPGNRGWLRCAEPEGDGVFINTTTGCATYPADAEFIVWGFRERDFVRRQWHRARGGTSRCPACSKGYRTEAGYQRHIVTHADDTGKPICNCLLPVDLMGYRHQLACPVSWMGSTTTTEQVTR